VDRIVADEAGLEGREREHRPQRDEPQPPPAGQQVARAPRDREADAGQEDRRRPLPLGERVLERHRLRVARDDLDRPAHVVVDPRQRLARRGPADRERAHGRRCERHHERAPGRGRHRERDHREPRDRDARVELREQLDPRQCPEPEGDGLRRPAADPPRRERHGGGEGDDDRRLLPDRRGERDRHQRGDEQRPERPPQPPDQRRGQSELHEHRPHEREPGAPRVDEQRLAQEAERPVGEDDVGAEVQPVVQRLAQRDLPRAVEIELRLEVPGHRPGDRRDRPGGERDERRGEQRGRVRPQGPHTAARR
jgi:hypothetical protein